MLVMYSEVLARLGRKARVVVMGGLMNGGRQRQVRVEQRRASQPCNLICGLPAGLRAAN